MDYKDNIRRFSIIKILVGGVHHCHWWKGRSIATGGDAILLAYCEDIVMILYVYLHGLVVSSSVYHKDNMRIIRG